MPTHVPGQLWSIAGAGRNYDSRRGAMLGAIHTGHCYSVQERAYVCGESLVQLWSEIRTLVC